VQAYRYRYKSSLVQRQQSKWFLFGIAILCVAFVVFNFDLPGQIIPALRQPGLTRLVYNLVGLPIYALALMAPLTAVVVAILRYKLWEIDLIIRRTLVYGLLTTALAGLYFVSVVALQTLARLISGQAGQSQLAIIVSTLGIAALFSPLRRNIQSGIDRRFYRRRYGAEQALAAFSTALRGDVDIDHLSGHLVATVQDTLQPNGASLWLSDSKGARKLDALERKVR
jgi:hypothetical protein